MKVWSVYFSATGTTEKIVKKVAGTVAAKLEAETDVFDFTLPAARTGVPAFSEDDVVVFGVPVYAGRVPNVLIKYIASFVGGGAAAVPVVLYGNRNYDDGLIELRNTLESCGFKTVSAAAFIGEHSFSKTLAAGRPDSTDMALAEEFAEKTAEKLKGEWQNPVFVKGSDPIRPYYQPRDRQGNPVNILKVKPKTNEKCVKCKLCAKSCPMGSISFDDPSAVEGICIKCGACVKKCPMGAKYYDDAGYLYHKTELELGYERRAEPELFY